MSVAETPTVFLVDDDEDLRRSIGWLVESAGFRARTFATAEDFFAEYTGEEAGCLVLDVRLPGSNGLDLHAELIRRGLAPPTIIITGHARVHMAVDAFKAGAIDFLQKPFGDQALLDSIRKAVLLDRQNRDVRRDAARCEASIARLTPRERQVLDLVVAGKPNKVIAAELGISAKTVEIHRGRVMEKMRASSVADLVRVTLLAKQVETRPSRGAKR